MFERFTRPARDAVIEARKLAIRLNHATVGPEHVLYGILYAEEGLGAQIATASGMRATQVEAEIAENAARRAVWRSRIRTRTRSGACRACRVSAVPALAAAPAAEVLGALTHTGMSPARELAPLISGTSTSAAPGFGNAAAGGSVGLPNGSGFRGIAGTGSPSTGRRSLATFGRPVPLGSGSAGLACAGGAAASKLAANPTATAAAIVPAAR